VVQAARERRFSWGEHVVEFVEGEDSFFVSDRVVGKHFAIQETTAVADVHVIRFGEEQEDGE